MGWEGLGARGGSMRARRVARAGRWAAHHCQPVADDTNSLYSQRRRNQAAPLPCRHGESNPEPCRPSGRQGGPANGFFRVESPEKSAAQAVKYGVKVKGEGLCGLCAKRQGGTRKDRWGHELLWDLACVCLADDRTAATCFGFPFRGSSSATYQFLPSSAYANKTFGYLSVCQ